RTHRVDFLRESPEDPGIPALEADDASMPARGVDDHPVDVPLPRARAAGRLSDVDDLGARPYLVEHRPGNEAIVNHGVGLAQPAERLQRDELGIAGTGAHEGDERTRHQVFPSGSARTRTAHAFSSGCRESGSRTLSVRLLALFQKP